MKQIDDLLGDSTLFSVSFTREPGSLRVMATLMPKGKGDWRHGYGATAQEALDDLTRCEETLTLPGLE